MKLKHPGKDSALRISFDNDGGFNILSGQLKEIPEGWKKVRPDYFEPQWPECRMRGLSKRVTKGMPIITIHCNQSRSIVDFNTCAVCIVAKPCGPRLTTELLEQEMAVVDRGEELTNLTPHLESEEDPKPSSMYPTEHSKQADAEWPACIFRALVEDEGCCPKLKCTCHSKGGKSLIRKNCMECNDRKSA